MTQLTINDLNTTTELEHSAMTSLRGGLNATINNAQSANQAATAAAGAVFALNNPISAPSNVLTEANPIANLNLNTINLTAAAQNAIGLGTGFNWPAAECPPQA